MFHDLRPEHGHAPALEKIRVDTPTAAAMLHQLPCLKQFKRAQLDDPVVLMQSTMFK